MKTCVFKYISFLLMMSLSLSIPLNSSAQCPNAGFENGDFTGWGGSFSQSTALPQGGGTQGCQTGTGPGTCLTGTGPCTTYNAASGCFIPCVTVPCITVYTGIYPDPFRHHGLAIGTPNQASNVTPENSQFIMSSGFDAVVGSALPVVNPNGGGKYSARLGNAQQEGGGESLMYKLAVDSRNSSFTYSYAVVLDGGSHDQYQQPYFKIRMFIYGTAGDSTQIPCAAYDVNGITAPNIGGFQTLSSGAQWKNWSSVTVPLDNYIGKTVGIQFITRDCCPGCTATDSTASAGTHYAYAYIDASCDPLKIIPTAAAVCAGTNDTLTAPSAKTYSWTGPGIVSGGSSQAVIVNQPGKYTVAMSTLSNTPCTYTLSTTMPGSLIGGAAITVNSVTTCVGGSAILTASGGASYTWAPGGQMTASLTAPTTTTGTTTYTVTGASASCGSGTAVGSVTVSPLPTSPFTVTSVCVGNGSTITYTGNASPGDTYTWDFAGGTVLSGSGQGPYSVSWASSGSKNVTLKVTVGNCVSPLTTNVVTVSPGPLTTVSSQTVCAGSSATLTAGGANTYVWSNASTSNTLTDSPTSTKSYTVTGSGAGCTSTAVGTITVDPYPMVSVNNPTICEGSKPAILTASGAATYSWSTGAVTDTISDSPASTTSYTVTGTTNTCATSAVATITVSSKPTITVNSPAICQGLSGSLTPAGGNSYIWSDSTFIAVKNITPIASKTYTVYGSTANCSGLPIATAADQQAYFTCWSGGCINSAVATVTLILKPIIVVNSPTICIGQPATLIANGGATYDWSGGQTGNTITVSPLTTTSYTVSDNTVGCSGSSVGKVTVNPLPVVTVNSATICAGQSATLIATGASTYSWSNGSAVNPLVVPLQNTTTYTVIGTSAVGCKDTSITTVTVNPLPVVTASSTSVCDGLTAKVTASGASTYQWSNGSTTDSLSVSPNKTTRYTVTGTDNNNCSATAISTITVFPKPGTDFTITPQPAFVSYPNITFTDKSSKDVNYWHWDFGDGDTLAPNTKNPEHLYAKVEATYTVTLNVLNGGFCPNSVTHEVIIGPDYSFFIPNAFSPNGDGENDFFFGKGKGILEYELMIFDRWGNFIFYANDINKGWNGKANGGADVAQQDVYVWKVNLTDVYKKKHSFIGTVTLIKGE